MPIAFKCPGCGKKYNVNDELAGKVAACSCGVKLRIPQTLAATAPAPMPEPDYDMQDEPVQEQAYEESYSEQPYDDGMESEPVEEPAMGDDFGDVDVDVEASEAPAEDYYSEPAAEESYETETESYDAGEDYNQPEEPAEDEDESFASDEDSEEEEEMATPKSWVGRIFILLGAACLIASLFVPWFEASAPAPKAAPAVTEEKADNATATDETADADADKPADETAADTAKTAPATGAAKTYTLMELALEKGTTDPLGYVAFAMAGVAAILLILALIPGVIISGTIQILFGLLLSLGVLGSTGATLFVFAPSNDIAALFAN
ncbi:MAG: hypothetical protein JXR97_00600, partial [Planctomycetes bacterium]|nr:hypothetical protein [Planctomycetota bacterium]